MSSDFRTALAKRRTYYNLTSACPVSDADLRDIVEYAVNNTPSAFNSQSARAVLLLRKEHAKLWNIVRETLRKIVPADSFGPTDAKMDSFTAGYGTVLFFEDRAVIRKLQEDFPTYADEMPHFSQHSAGMLNLVVWVMLRDAGVGASLQHYGNLIEAEVARAWGFPSDWQLIAQMPFGGIGSEPGVPDREPIDKRVKVIG